MISIRPPAIEGTFTIKNFTFESGETLLELRVGYVMYGTLNAQCDNLCLVMPGTGNLRHSTLEHVGPGRAYDTDHYCVVCTDAIGGGTSSQPADGLHERFPKYSIRDIVHAQFALVRDGLGLGLEATSATSQQTTTNKTSAQTERTLAQPIALLAGASMGAFQTLEWLIHYPDSVRNAVLLVPGWQANNTFKLATARMFDFIELDANWQGGACTLQPKAGQQAAGRHYFAWTVTDDYLERTDYTQVEREAQTAGDWFAHWDAMGIVRRYQASARHDVTVPFNGDLKQALQRIKAKVLVLPCSQDRLLGVEGAKEIAQGIQHATYCEVDSNTGHMAWRPVPGSPQTQIVTRHVREFLGLD